MVNFVKSAFRNKVIDRVPDIDSGSAEGLKPDKIKGEVRIKALIFANVCQCLLMFPDALNHNSNSTPFFQISFNEVKFNYPARKDVPILRG